MSCSTSRDSTRSGSEPVQAETVTKLAKEGKAPKWVIQGGEAFPDNKKNAIYGLGSAWNIMNPTLLRRTAEVGARRDVAEHLQVYIRGLFESTVAEDTTGAVDKHTVEQHVQDVMRQSSQRVLSGVAVVDYWEHPDQRMSFALAKLDFDRLEDALGGVESTDARYRELDDKVRERIRANHQKAQEGLIRETERLKEHQ